MSRSRPARRSVGRRCALEAAPSELVPRPSLSIQKSPGSRSLGGGILLDGKSEVCAAGAFSLRRDGPAMLVADNAYYRDDRQKRRPPEMCCREPRSSVQQVDRQRRRHEAEAIGDNRETGGEGGIAAIAGGQQGRDGA